MFLPLLLSIMALSLANAQCLVDGGSDMGPLEFYSNAAPTDTRFLEEVARIEDMFNVKAMVMYSNRPYINAQAMKAPVQGFDGMIVIYDGLLRSLQGDDYLLFVAILAHEYGHVLQRKMGLDGSSISGKQVELHADYLAGVYVQMRAIELYLDIPNRDPRKVMDNMFRTYSSFGERLGDSGFGAVDPHGTSQERSHALWGSATDLSRELNYIEQNRAKLNAYDHYYSIRVNDRWLKIAEYFYRPGLSFVRREY
ncbi:MAG: M48 family metalloprotease [Flavobacteriales bacterium]|nr:M48 family metalloprotease [Flavobacteriales bacterium]